MSDWVKVKFKLGHSIVYNKRDIYLVDMDGSAYLFECVTFRYLTEEGVFGGPYKDEQVVNKHNITREEYDRLCDILGVD